MTFVMGKGSLELQNMRQLNLVDDHVGLEVTRFEDGQGKTASFFPHHGDAREHCKNSHAQERRGNWTDYREFARKRHTGRRLTRSSSSS